LARSKSLKIGVTGGIGSGKSEVCSVFRRLGVPVLSADEIAKNISSSHPRAKKKLLALFGNQAYGPDGVYNRAFIASRIFSQKSLQKKLEAIIHPLVESEIIRKFKSFEPQHAAMVVVEAALIYEAGLDKLLDTVIVVDADEPERIARVRKRDSVSEEDVRRRMDAQLDVARKLDKADYVVKNNGTPDELETKVKFLYSLFQHL
jgi:dephospho-CoA kinase